MTACAKRGCKIDIDAPTKIKVKFPIFIDGKISIFHLCRNHFIHVNKKNLSAEEFLTWIWKRERN